ncbi:cold-shock protein [Vibrio breoganii]|uniref:cold-shock protein n=1 Tax=Vibrio breoganii TaxID=553239 RepID=UPI00031AC71E|nr:cold shock domain-containing protein [Vibrio breoganii]OED94252.1 hypothetical protein A1QG_05780 [Vibrio breoganii ZF-29]
MPEGRVRSYSAEKGYGFLGNKDNSYFFHQNDLPAECMVSGVSVGDRFSFDDVPGPKGFKARRLVKVDEVKALRLAEKMIINKDLNPRRGEVLMRVACKTPFARDPQVVRDYLFEGAKRVGCNAVLNWNVERATWSSGNYNYTMHYAVGDLCLVADTVSCLQSAKVSIERELEKQMTEAKAGASNLVVKYNQRRFWQRFPFKLVIFGAMLIWFFFLRY